MTINWTDLSIKDITNLYLYGQWTTPTDLTQESLIRSPEAAMPPVTLDAASFMATGPGRFANAASQSYLVSHFMSGLIIPATGARQEFLVDDLVARLRNNSDLRPLLFDGEKYNRFFSFQQRGYDTLSSDFAQRFYIYGSSGFALPREAKFVIEADGTRKIENFAMLPGNDNFDFQSANLATGIADGLLKPLFDPSSIGRTVDIEFEDATKDQIQRITYTASQYLHDALNDNYSPTIGIAVVASMLPALVNGLWESGVIRALDDKGRAIIYGTTGSDALMALQFEVNPLIKSELREAANTNGVVIVAGPSNDVAQGGVKDDALYGGSGDDKLNGGVGNDELYGNEGKDTLDGQEGSDHLFGGDGDDVLEGGSGADFLYGDAENDQLSGGSEDDQLYGGEGADTLTGR